MMIECERWYGPELITKKYGTCFVTQTIEDHGCGGVAVFRQRKIVDGSLMGNPRVFGECSKEYENLKEDITMAMERAA